MPRCQRTFRRLPKENSENRAGNSAAEVWACPYCPDTETYETVEERDLLRYAAYVEAACLRDFGHPPDSAWPIRLLLGLHPECVREPSDRRYEIYLQRKSDGYQCRLQIGHEIFHRVGSQGRVFHWTHEMLACRVSIRLLRENGLEEYADQTEYEYRQQAESLPLEALIENDPWASGGQYPDGYYGRAYITGLALEEIMGWEALTRLAYFTSRGGRDSGMNGWLSSLPRETRSRIERIMGITMERKR